MLTMSNFLVLLYAPLDHVPLLSTLIKTIFVFPVLRDARHVQVLWSVLLAKPIMFSNMPKLSVPH